MTPPIPSSKTPADRPWIRHLVWLPVAALTSLVLLFVQARLVLGHWPRGFHWVEGNVFPVPSELDPGSLGFGLPLTYGLIALSFIGLFIWLPLRLFPGRAARQELAGLFLGLLGWLFVIARNPGDVWNWFLD